MHHDSTSQMFPIPNRKITLAIAEFAVLSHMISQHVFYATGTTQCHTQFMYRYSCSRHFDIEDQL